MGAQSSDESSGKLQPQAVTPRPTVAHRIVSGVLGVLAVLVILGNVTLLLTTMYGERSVPWSDVPLRFRLCEYGLRAVAVAVGVIVFFAALFIRRGFWKRGTVFAAVASILAIANPSVNRWMQRQFAGDSYTLTAQERDLRVVVYDSPNGEDSVSDSRPLGWQGPTATTNGRTGHAIQTVRNSAGMELVLVPAGVFAMGRSESLQQLYDTYPVIARNAKDAEFKALVASEQPQHEVRITKPFYMGICNVTIAQFEAFVDETGYQTIPESDGAGGSGYTEGDAQIFDQKPEFTWRFTGFPQQSDSPVVNITWHDANAYCDWLSKVEGRPYRLPTSAEFEYACRAGTTTRFSCGDSIEGLPKVANVADLAYFSLFGKLTPESVIRIKATGAMVDANDGYAFTAPVGKFPPNAFGLCEMHGNAATWCTDWYSPDDYARGITEDPQGPPAGTARIVRGGSWQFYPAFCRSASRFIYSPSRRESFIGMRVVCAANGD